MSKFMNAINDYYQNKEVMDQLRHLEELGMIAILNNSVYGKVPYNKPKAISINELREKMGMGDIRYNEPKESPKADVKLVEETIISTEIYRRARLEILRDKILTPEARDIILKAQRKQVAYGLDKYPEPLNPNTWTISETVDHIMDESIDKLHYLVMLRIKLEQALASGANDIITVRNASTKIGRIQQMIDNTIEDMGYLIGLSDSKVKGRPNDSMDAMAHAVHYSITPSGEITVADGDTLRVFSDDELKALAEGTNKASTRFYSKLSKEEEAKRVKTMSQHKCCDEE